MYIKKLLTLTKNLCLIICRSNFLEKNVFWGVHPQTARRVKTERKRQNDDTNIITLHSFFGGGGYHSPTLSPL